MVILHNAFLYSMTAIKTYKKFISLLLISLAALSANATAQAELNVSVDRNPVNLQDTFQITIEATSNVSGSPDLAPLKKDFDLLGVSQSSSYSFGTGGNQRSIKRIITAQAKHAGVITIPSISWDSLQSQPISIKVLDGQQSQPGSTAKSFYVELESSVKSPYVQGQIILTAKAFSNTRFAKGAFEDPKLPDGLVAKRTGNEDDVYQTSVNGTAYQVQERRYIVYAERSGEYTVDPILFQGYFQTGQRDLFGQYQWAPKRTRSNAINLNIKPIPNTAKRPWIPAKQVMLSHFLSDGDYNVGEPITLTISTIADGLIAEQLPDIKLDLPDGLKAYPDQPELDSNWDNGSVTAKRIDKIAIIPTRAGTFELPSLNIHWWNIETDKPETTTLEAIKLTVSGSAAANSTAAPQPPSQDQGQAQDQPTSSTNQAVSEETDISAKQDGAWPILAIITIAVLALLWLVTLTVLFIVLRKNGTAVDKPAKTATPLFQGLSKKQLIKTLPKSTPKQAAEQLVQWARTELNTDIHSIGQIPPYADKPLSNAINNLNQQLYSQQQGEWSADILISALNSFSGHSEEAVDNNRTVPLYPE